jgi:hypothetical protein
VYVLTGAPWSTVLEPGGAAGVAEHLRADLAFLPARAHCHCIEQLAEVGKDGFATGSIAREQKPAGRVRGEAANETSKAGSVKGGAIG